jgi:hypothetical protein
MVRRRLLVALALAAAPRVARAEPPAGEAALRLPLPEAQRPVTLPRLVFAPGVDFQVDRRPDLGTFGELDVSGAIGLTDDLAVHALVAPLELWAPNGGGFRYGETNRNFGPDAGVTVRFVRGPVELAGDLSGSVYAVPGLSGGSVTPGLRLRVHATDMLRFDVDPSVTLQFATTNTQSAIPASLGVGTTGAAVIVSTANPSANTARVFVPVTLLGYVTPSLDIGVTTGLTIYDTSDARNSTGIPAGLLLGYAVPGPHGPILDVDPFFNFPYLLLPARPSATTDTGQYQVGARLTGYLYL